MLTTLLAAVPLALVFIFGSPLEMEATILVKFL